MIETVAAPRSRFAPLRRSGLVLVERDEKLLVDLFLHQTMRRDQIQALYFGSVPRCNARLRQLFDHGYVSRHFLAEAPYGAQAVYLAGRAAAAVIAARLERDAKEVRAECRSARSPQFLSHTLAIADFYLALRQAAVLQGEAEMESWLPERLCRHEYEIRSAGGAWRQEVFKPDAFVRLARRGSSELRSYFVEIDRGHTSARQFALKLKLHERYRESGLFGEIFGGERFRTLVVTTGENRLRHLLALAEEKESDLFWFTTFAAVSGQGALSAIWQAPFAAQPTTLL